MQAARDTASRPITSPDAVARGCHRVFTCSASVSANHPIGFLLHLSAPASPHNSCTYSGNVIHLSPNDPFGYDDDTTAQDRTTTPQPTTMSAPGPAPNGRPFARNSRNTPFARNTPTSPLNESDSAMGHLRHRSLTNLTNLTSPPLGRSDSARLRSNSNRNSTPVGTFAPQFISEDDGDAPRLGGIVEGENDFSGKRYVWLRDPVTAFVRGWVVEDLPGGRILVQCDNGTQQDVDAEAIDKVNPAKFDKADDMAELTHLNEPSVIHNLHMRYQADLIYTYSGLFLVTVNPYCPLPIYSREYINMYRGRSREETKPHIFAMADHAFRNLIEEGTNQSILVT
jgi:myosin protein heavy chain